MAKTKDQLMKEAQTAGLIPADVEADDYTAAQLEALLGGDIKVSERQSADKPIVAPDGHVVLSEEDIKNRA